MTKAKISEYDAVASNNTDVNGVNIAEGCPPSGMNNMGREIMAALKRFQVGSDGDGVTVGGNLVVSGSSTVNTFTAGPVSATTLNTSGAVVFNDAGADVDFRVEGDTDANLLFVDASADVVLIGTNTTTNNLRLNERLAVVNVGTFGGASLTGYNGASALPVIIDFNKSRGSSDGSMTVVAANDELGGFVFRGADGTQFQDAAIIVGQVDSAPGAGDMPGRLVFKTTPDGSTTPAERMRITSGGYFKASPNAAYNNSSGSYHELNQNTTNEITVGAFNSSASPYGYLFETTADPNNGTNYGFRYAANGGAVGVYTIYSNGTVATRSDAKWKKNIETTRDGYVDDLARLRVVKYNWYNHEEGTPKELGLIAQEVEEVFPGLVLTEEELSREVRTREVEKTRVVTEAVLDEDGNEIEPAVTETYTEEEEYTERVATGEYTKSIKFSVFTPMLIKAVQELKAITDTQAQTIAALEARIAALENA